MKEFHGAAAARVTASPAQSLALLGDVAGYPSWYPAVVREVEVVSPATAQAPTVARVTMRANLGPLQREFRFLVEVSRDSSEVIRLNRLPNEPTDPERLSLSWRITPGGDLAVELYALLDVPRLLPVQGAGDAVASGFLAAACQALESGRGS